MLIFQLDIERIFQFKEVLKRFRIDCKFYLMFKIDKDTQWRELFVQRSQAVIDGYIITNLLDNLILVHKLNFPFS
jgi:hypothetical protein